MEPADWNLLRSLLANSNFTHILLVQDEVIIKGNPKDDSRNYTGRLMLVKQPMVAGSDVSPATPLTASDPPVSSVGITSAQYVSPSGQVVGCGRQTADEFFLIWVPYTFLATEFPKLLPVFLNHLRHTVANTDVDEPTEWRYMMCVPTRSIAKVQRRQNLRGMRFITLCFLNGSMGFPFIFCHGGVTKFLDVLKMIAPVRQSPIVADDFIVYGDYQEALAAGRIAEHTLSSDKMTSRMVPQEGYRGFGSSPPNFRSLEKLQETLYDRGLGSGGSRLRASIATTIDGVRSFFFRGSTDHRERRLGRDSPLFSGRGDDTLATSFPPTEDSTADEPFELLEGLIPVENQIPRIAPPQGRSMGQPLTAAEWDDCFIGKERRLNPKRYAEAMTTAYRGGVERSIRLQVWCFVLQAYPDPLDSTEEERNSIREGYAQMYERLTNQWKNIFPEQESHFSAFRKVRVAIEKDVVRTDRAHSAYADDKGVKQQMLRQVLMAYAMLNFDLGYCQGMSDVLSPIVLLAETEVEAFMCFRCFLCGRCEHNFRRDVRMGMEAQLSVLGTLVEFFIPRLYAHLLSQHAEDMSFCFRWLLMFFKREFTLDETMLLWDVILCCPNTPQFELFVAAALLKALEPQILEQHLTYDELLKFANTTAGNLDVNHLILLAHEFYEEVAGYVMKLHGCTTKTGEFQLTLNEILQALRDCER